MYRGECRQERGLGGGVVSFSVGRRRAPARSNGADGGSSAWGGWNNSIYRGVTIIFVLCRALGNLRNGRLLKGHHLGLLFRGLRRANTSRIFPNRRSGLANEPQSDGQASRFFLLFTRLRRYRFKGGHGPLAALRRVRGNFRAARPVHRLTSLGHFRLAGAGRLVTRTVPFIGGPGPFPYRVKHAGRVILRRQFLL